MNVRPREGGRQQRCGFCHGEDLRGKPIVWCEACGAMTHAECVSSHGACPAPGCGKPMAISASTSGKGETQAPGSLCLFGIDNCKAEHNAHGWHAVHGAWTAPARVHDFSSSEKARSATDNLNSARQRLAARHRATVRWVMGTSLAMMVLVVQSRAQAVYEGTLSYDHFLVIVVMSNATLGFLFWGLRRANPKL